MSPIMQSAASTATYTPSSDTMDRHEYGVSKNRKTASTGGGRAWSEDEEVYLLQTRLQKMPYKHIAAHLKKTELACRLHYHQLSHGSNRRKRTTSVSSGSSQGQSPPTVPASVPSPIHETPSRSVSPTGSSVSYSPAQSITLPSIHLTANSASPRLPAILPKPLSMNISVSAVSTPTAHGYPTPIRESTTLPPVNFPPPPPPASMTGSSSSGSSGGGSNSGSMGNNRTTTPPLRLECSALPPTHVDQGRLQAAYNAHRSAFWSAVSNDYGPGATPSALEQAWRAASCPHHVQHTHQTNSPITPVESPDERPECLKSNKTRIAAILGIDADPRSPKEREMVRRIEEFRPVAPTAA